MRQIKYIVLHCTATQPRTSVTAITNYWKNTLKWRSPGYHYLIDSTGYEHDLLSEDKIANGVAGYNAVSIHVSYIGGIDKKGKPMDTRTPQQKDALRSRLHALKTRYPDAIIQGHRDFPGVKKACPSFDAKAEYANLV